ncbi:MAG: hypothetical protein GY820_20070, partial [Gammaproteobacteria bacterium]|nr:hypothetical protein [Gammaproteobacteria bacterium]
MSTLPQTSNADVSRANLLNQNAPISTDLSSHQSMQQTPQQPAFGDPGISATYREENGNGYGQSGNGYGRGQATQDRGENRYHKIPNVLCTKFGENVETTRDFNTFEREFSTMCRLQAVPDHQKLDRFVLHLEGAILKHATCWLDEREDQDTQYVQLVEELRKSFQKIVKTEEAEKKLLGRKWNVYEMTIDEFIHQTRLLVQQAYPDEQRKWESRIKSFIQLGVPHALEMVVSTMKTLSINEVEEWIRNNTDYIDRNAQPDVHADQWVQQAYRDWAQKNKMAKGPDKFVSDPKGIVPKSASWSGNQSGERRFNNNTGVPQGPGGPGVNFQSYVGRCYICGSPNHRQISCTRGNMGPRPVGQQQDFR